MNLDDLGLNRFLYRDNQNIDTTDAISSAYGDIGSNQGGAGAGSGTPGQSNGVQPGSVPIVGTLLQSSSGDDRVEINPNDHFYAYNNGDVVVDISKDGIIADEMVIVHQVTEDLEVTNTFTYDGELQPVIYTGIIDSAGVISEAPVGWTASILGVGTYSINHSLNSVDYKLFVAPLSGHYRSQISTRAVNNAVVSWQETNFVTATFPVVGGGGGTVDVDGVRDTGTPEIGVYTDFEFILVLYP